MVDYAYRELYVRQFGMKNITLKDKHSNRTLKEVVEYYNIDNTILISVVDTGYVEMALNLWETSYKKFNITNYIFICITSESFKYLNQLDYDFHAYYYDEAGLDGTASYYASTNYIKKTVLKTELSMTILRIGYDVLIVDVDVVFLQNPLPYFSVGERGDWDIIAQSEFIWEVNTGFYWLKANAAVIELQNRVMKLSIGVLSNEQDLTNKILRDMTHLKINRVTDRLFCPGCSIFPDPQTNDYEKLNMCVVFHNNCQKGYDNKVYKFKEMHMWVVETNGYYSSSINKYITYKIDEGYLSHFSEHQLLTLVLKIGQKLKRSVILPSFHCKKGTCNYLNKFEDIHKLETKYGGLYRESSFLSHPNVPDAVKSSRSPLVTIELSERNDNNKQFNILVDPASLKKEVTMIILREIAKFHLEKYHILQLHFSLTLPGYV